MDRLLENMDALLGDAGVPDDIREELTGASMGIREFVAAAEPDVLLEDGVPVPLPGWDVVTLHTPGHSPGHVCFHDRAGRLLFSGDHVLPRISPSVAVHVQQPVNPLADFLDALRRVRDLDIDEVLPAHEWRFRGLDTRVDELLDHHRRRLDETHAAISAAPGLTCWEITLRLRWSRDWSQIVGYMRRAAVGETLAHLVLLESSGRARRDRALPIRWFPTGDISGR
jgi:glyoxylase-like metal-dependent hydrolase (beta-lactamase superfamily II)